jgi:hypothetical protein
MAASDAIAASGIILAAATRAAHESTFSIIPVQFLLTYTTHSHAWRMMLQQHCADSHLASTLHSSRSTLHLSCMSAQCFRQHQQLRTVLLVMHEAHGSTSTHNNCWPDTQCQ